MVKPIREGLVLALIDPQNGVRFHDARGVVEILCFEGMIERGVCISVGGVPVAGVAVQVSNANVDLLVKALMEALSEEWMEAVPASIMVKTGDEEVVSF